MTRLASFFQFLKLWFQANGRSLLYLILGVYIPLQIFAVLALKIWGLQGGLAWDVALLTVIHQSANNNLDHVAVWLTQLGSVRLVGPFVLTLLPFFIHQKRWRSLAYLAITLLGGCALNVAAKTLWRRARPNLWIENYPIPTDFSFPSGHAMTSSLLVATLVILTWKTRWSPLVIILGTVYVITIGWTRVYLGVHYPSDIVAGWMLALAWAIGISILVKPALSPSKRQ
jgi:membrane-associated phospholipid phosphatase